MPLVHPMPEQFLKEHHVPEQQMDSKTRKYVLEEELQKGHKVTKGEEENTRALQSTATNIQC